MTNIKLTMSKFSVWSELYCEDVMLYRPVLESYLAPVAEAYLLNALLAM